MQKVWRFVAQGRGRRVAYEQIKQNILDDIHSGRLERGDKLPSEREMCEIYSVSRATVRQAIFDLVSEGILETFPGKGTFVKQATPLDRNQTKNVAFIRCVRHAHSPSIADGSFYTSILEGIEKTAASQGVHCLVRTINEVTPDLQSLEELVAKVDGLICAELRTPAFLRRLQEFKRPLVLVSPSVVTDEVDVVEIDNVGGAYQGVKHLIDLGHRRIAFVGGPSDSRPSNEREAGYLKAMEEAGLLDQAQTLHLGGWDAEDGYRSAALLLGEREARRPTAIFAASDVLAMGVYHAIQEAGLQVGSDVSVLGFDDIALAVQCRPPLSTVHVRKVEMGKNAVKLLWDWINEERDYPLRVTVPTTLHMRASTASPGFGSKAT